MIQLDFMFPLGSEWYPVLSVVDRDSGHGAYTAVAVKGAGRYAVAFVLNVLQELGVHNIILQTDLEPADVDLAKVVSSRFNGTCVLRQAPRGASAINRSVERLHLSVQE